ncbi:hypothetical protein D3C78_1015020 [compost metagenome]
MHSKLCLHSKIDILKSLEAYGYSVAYYILQEEGLAAEATMTALLEISREELFFEEPPAVQQAKLKRMIMRETLNVKISLLTG